MSDFDCCPFYGDDDSEPGWTVEHRMLVARKAHDCFECRESIPKGTTYEVFKYAYRCYSGTSDGLDVQRTCASCVEIRNHFTRKCDGYTPGRMWHDIEENMFPDMRAGGPCMEGLSPAAKGRLFERRLVWLEEDRRDKLEKAATMERWMRQLALAEEKRRHTHAGG